MCPIPKLPTIALHAVGLLALPGCADGGLLTQELFWLPCLIVHLIPSQTPKTGSSIT